MPTEGGMVSCLGETERWSGRSGLAGTFSASPVDAENHIYVLSDEGETTVLEAGAAFTVSARNALAE